MPDPHERISVSRDALRADLAEMELRIRTYFDGQMALKVDRSDLRALSTRLDAVDRGDLTEAHRRSVIDLVETIVNARGNAVWTRREQIGDLVQAMTALGMIVLTVLIATGKGL